jgi:hypothetical protein
MLACIGKVLSLKLQSLPRLSVDSGLSQDSDQQRTANIPQHEGWKYGVSCCLSA